MAIGPHHFHQEVQVRLAHELVALHPDVALTALQHRSEAQVVEYVEALYASAGKCLLAGQAHLELVGLQLIGIDQFDAGIQWLVEGRIQGDLTQAQRHRGSRAQHRAGSEREKQCAHLWHNASSSTNFTGLRVPSPTVVGLSTHGAGTTLAPAPKFSMVSVRQCACHTAR